MTPVDWDKLCAYISYCLPQTLKTIQKDRLKHYEYIKMKF